jgi:peptide/nickel transport system permease protein
MIPVILQRLGVSILVIFVVTLLTFVFTNVAVDPARAMAGENASEDAVALVRKEYGFDRPVTAQYASWLGGVLQGDFGNSLRERRPVTAVLADAFPVTLELSGFALTLTLIAAIPLGVLSGWQPGSAIDRAGQIISAAGMGVPTFWLGLELILIFGVRLRVLPISGASSVLGFVLPSVVLAFHSMPIIVRLVRTGMIDVLEADYIRTARAKGLHPLDVVLRHGLRNALMPIVLVTAVQFGAFLSGSVVIENVFALHGTGYIAWQSIVSGDLPVLQALVLIFSVIYVGLVFVSDLLNALLDPRIRVRS